MTPASPFTLYEDRSGLAADALCPRLRWLTRETLKAPGHVGGIESARKSIYPLIGGAVHTGLNHLLLIAKQFEEDAIREGGEFNPNFLLSSEDGGAWRPAVFAAADFATDEFRRAIAMDAIFVPDCQTPEQQEWKKREALALVEGLVLMAGFRLVPNLVERFRVVEVEQEKAFVLGTLKLYPDLCPSELSNDHYWTQEGYSTGTPRDVEWHEQTICADCHAEKVEYQIIFESRADALLEERSSGDLYVHSWKTSADYGKMEEDAFRHDVQGLSEAIGIELSQSLAVWNAVPGHGEHITPLPQKRIQGIQMAFLLKGRKSYGQSRDDGSYGENEVVWHGLGPGLRYHYSALTHGWRMFSHGITLEDDQSSWAWSYAFPKPENKSGKGRLGKGWDPVAIFDHYPSRTEGWTPTRQWFMDLMEGRWQPECGDPFGGMIAMPEPWSRSDLEMEDWLEEAQAASERIHSAAVVCREAEAEGDYEKLRHLLSRHFPKNRKSCHGQFGADCAMLQICWGGAEVRERPLESGLYVHRTAHHPSGTVVENKSAVVEENA